jgi:hypothetical protein
MQVRCAQGWGSPHKGGSMTKGSAQQAGAHLYCGYGEVMR